MRASEKLAAVVASTADVVHPPYWPGTGHLHNRAIDSTVEQAKPLFDARRHALAVQHSASRPLVRGDRNRLVQVFANLLANAAEYTRAGAGLLVGSCKR